MKKIHLLVIASFLLIFINQNVNAGDDGVHSHHVAVFGGATTNFHADHTDGTLGLDYEFRIPALDHLFGTGVFGGCDQVYHFFIGFS